MQRIFKTTLLLLLIVFSSCIHNPKPEECEVKTVTIVKIKEGSSYDIMFFENKGSFYYINRGMEQGLNLDSLNVKVLNKTVTLHLPKLIYGTSNHIAQLMVEDEIIFTEF